LPGTGQATLVWQPAPEPEITGYKVYFGEASGFHTNFIAVGSVPEATLPGLEDGTTYYIVVTAINSFGLESLPSDEFSFRYQSQPPVTYPSDRLVLLDISDASIEPPISPPPDLPDDGGQSADAPAQNTLMLTFAAPIAADYAVWCRVRAPAAGSDAFYVSLDGGPVETFHVFGTQSPPAIYPVDWIWCRIATASGTPRLFALPAGPHALGFQPWGNAEIDRVVLSSDPNLIPTDALPRLGDAVAITLAPRSRTIQAGEPTTFSVNAAGTGPLSYQWYKNGALLAGATGPTFTIASATPGDSGQFQVTVTSGSATESTDPAMLQVESGGTGPRVTRMSVAADRSVTFHVSGLLGADLTVYASTDMLHWTPIGTYTNSAGTITVSDPAAQSLKQRYYRLAGATEK
jgi:hypothetical protein